MPETRESLIAHYEAAWSALDRAIAGLNEARMTELTVDGWSVKDNLAHIAFWDEFRATEIERISAGHSSVMKMSHEQDEAINTMMYDLRRNLSLMQVLWEIQNTRRRLREAIASVTPRGLEPSNYGEAGLVSGHATEHAHYIREWRQKMGY